MIAMPASDFQSADLLPPSKSREDVLEELVKSQAAIIERQQAMLDGPQQAPGGKLSGQEKAAIIEILSKLDERIKKLEAATNGLDDLKKEVKESGEKIHEVHELARYSLKTLSVRCTTLEDRSKPQETATNQSHIETLWQELIRRQKAGQRGIIYADAAQLLKLDKSRICQLRALIAADSRFDIIWHPKKKNTKLICLKNYK